MKNKKMENKEPKIKISKNKELMRVTYVFVGLFIALMGYFVYFNVVLSADVINNPYNSRQDLFADRIIRGKILARDGEVLAETKVASDGAEIRNYPYANMFSHVIGYSINGKAGVELLGNFSLLRSNAFIAERISNEFKGEKNIGDNLVTTLDVAVQKAAYDALGSRKGAVVAVEPSTGKILAMVSKPDYDPNQIEAIWDSLLTVSEENDSRLLNRAAQGIYPPGSVFKIITALEYIRENPDYKEYHYQCEGSITEDDVTINCYHNKNHGEVDLETAFAKSCNAAFADMGLRLNQTKFMTTCSDLLFGAQLPSPLPYSKSRIGVTADGNGSFSEIGEKMQVAIGQGKTQMSPLHMALITSAIANKGTMMKPYLIECIENYEGDKVKQYKPSSYGRFLTEEEAAVLTKLMRTMVTDGTGSKLNGQSYTAAGKTGSAEYSENKEKSHAWFTGFAPAENPEIAVTVIVEEAGAGSEFAVPIAKQVFDAYFQQILP